MSFRNVCVFCGSSSGNEPIYSDAAHELGKILAQQGIGLIYGGGKVGLMGIIADTMLAYGGKVTGIIPQFLQDREVGHDDLSELIIVDSMHERKHLMARRSNAFIAMPGGWGTLEELAEVLTWAQLRLHPKPVGILNVLDFYDPLLKFWDHMVDEGFLRAPNRNLVQVHSNPATLLDMMYNFEPPPPKRNAGLDQT